MSKSVMTHQLAQCNDCSWVMDGMQDSGNIYSKAKTHARNNKHLVNIETGRNFICNFREDASRDNGD